MNSPEAPNFSPPAAATVITTTQLLATTAATSAWRNYRLAQLPPQLRRHDYCATTCRNCGGITTHIEPLRRSNRHCGSNIDIAPQLRVKAFWMDRTASSWPRPHFCISHKCRGRHYGQGLCVDGPSLRPMPLHAQAPRRLPQRALTIQDASERRCRLLDAPRNPNTEACVEVES